MRRARCPRVGIAQSKSKFGRRPRVTRGEGRAVASYSGVSQEVGPQRSSPTARGRLGVPTPHGVLDQTGLRTLAVRGGGRTAELSCVFCHRRWQVRGVAPQGPNQSLQLTRRSAGVSRHRGSPDATPRGGGSDCKGERPRRRASQLSSAVRRARRTTPWPLGTGAESRRLARGGCGPRLSPGGNRIRLRPAVSRTAGSSRRSWVRRGVGARRVAPGAAPGTSSES